MPAMSPSSFVKFSGLALLFMNLPALIAQEAALTEENLSRDLAANWKALQIQTKELTPEERIAALDEWQKTEQPKLEALKQKRIQSARQFRAHPAPLASPAPATDLDRIDVAIEKEFQPIRYAKLSPVDRIRLVDASMERTTALQERRKDILREMAVSANAATSLFNRSIPFDQNTPEGRLAAKGLEILEQTKNLTPEVRIAAVDAKKSELDSLSREVVVARRVAATLARPVQDKPAN